MVELVRKFASWPKPRMINSQHHCCKVSISSNVVKVLQSPGLKYPVIGFMYRAQVTRGVLRHALQQASSSVSAACWSWNRFNIHRDACQNLFPQRSYGLAEGSKVVCVEGCATLSERILYQGVLNMEPNLFLGEAKSAKQRARG